MAKTLLPESFACLFDPQQTFGNPLRTFGQSFANCVLQDRDFFWYAKFSFLYAVRSRAPRWVLQGQKMDTMATNHTLVVFHWPKQIKIFGIISK